jgi:hypothetical protein
MLRTARGEVKFRLAADGLEAAGLEHDAHQAKISFFLIVFVAFVAFVIFL